ncbi:MAG: AbrB/MazE/SpoVT family DNA-binding domain-containing protein [Candidatus Latescibacteria bacterium]|nr:AbrB/MazE/SpoVT family DNA-binding domain-containing protein [Candidatus Latescibacterota bacterium]MBT4140470.1 AbrB/MazE/SpoVT family DNA-binding domain-containing protein [Candidatus Latescibacterota bacterium]MBT5831425.1 AbrB/MazE/SpoVT family DNA-binding domain-containing protein [Candidatus Latescibacterota bacterium]
MGKVGNVQDVKLIPIGNSKGIRLSKSLIQKYHFVDQLILEETDRGILIRKPEENTQLSWEDTYKEMAQENEDWSDLDIALTDGLDEDDTQ